MARGGILGAISSTLRGFGDDDPRFRMNPWTLRFADLAMERAFWGRFAEELFRWVQVGSVMLFALVSLFGVVDYFAFPEIYKELWLVRYGFAVPLLLASLPVLLLPRFRLWAMSKLQEIMLYLAVSSVATFMGIGLVFGGDINEMQVYVSSLGLMFSLCLLYGFSRLRFAYAAPIGLTLAAVGLGWMQLFWRHDPMMNGAMIAHSLAITVVGWWINYTLESRQRHDFVRGVQLREARARTEQLLCTVMPAQIAQRLQDAERSGIERSVVADRHESVTVLVADIVGFTPLAERLDPQELAALLDRVFSCFDSLCEQHGVEKIKTLGDAWMAAAGVPVAKADHAEAAARLGREMLLAIDSLTTNSEQPVQLRIGMHTGSAVSGVIGRTRFAYDVWGEAVRGALAMEQAGAPGRVRISPEAAAGLPSALVLCEQVGDEQMYWLSMSP